MYYDKNYKSPESAAFQLNEEKFNALLNATDTPYIQLSIGQDSVESSTLPQGSRLGGSALWSPEYGEYPAVEGVPLKLLAQLNFKDMAQVLNTEYSPVPTAHLKGLLQFFISFKPGKRYSPAVHIKPKPVYDWSVVYHEEIIGHEIKDLSVFEVNGAPNFWPFKKQLNLIPSLEHEKCGIFDEYWSARHYHAQIFSPEQEKEINSIKNNGIKIGGYCRFEGIDPRKIESSSKENPWYLLLQIDSKYIKLDNTAEDNLIDWIAYEKHESDKESKNGKPSGVASFFIRQSDLEAKRFNKDTILFHFD